MTPEFIGVFIPIIAIVFGIGMGMFSTWTEHKRRSQLMEQLHRERMTALEKGQPMPELPPNLLSSKFTDGPVSRHNPLRALRSGVLLLGVGIVLYFALDRGVDKDTALFGLIPAVIGVANLVYAYALMRKQRQEGPGAG